ncbi:hypothetical protein ERO13_A08G110025v2, partial [Gossypium hirsutum]
FLIFSLPFLFILCCPSLETLGIYKIFSLFFFISFLYLFTPLVTFPIFLLLLSTIFIFSLGFHYSYTAPMLKPLIL